MNRSTVSREEIELGQAAMRSPVKNCNALAETFEVESIIDSNINLDTCRQYYKIRWKGYGAQDDTWEAKEKMNDLCLVILAYEAKTPGAKTACATTTI